MERKGRYIPTRLKKIRWLLKYKQTVAARKMGVHQGDLSKWENGEITPSLDNAFRLRILYDRPLEELFEFRFRKVQEDMERIRDGRQAKAAFSIEKSEE